MSGFLMLVVLLVIGGIVVAVTMRQLAKRAVNQASDRADQLAASKRIADEDLTRFGEQLRALDLDLGDRTTSSDAALHHDCSQAHQAYAMARRSLDSASEPHHVSRVTELLEAGRHAVACVRARLTGGPVPSRRPPCFFNPTHGPSTTHVTWGPAGEAPLDVPACAADADRVRAGADPYIRTVPVDGGQVPYWQAGPAYAPYAEGYYSAWRGSELISGVLVHSAD